MKFCNSRYGLDQHNFLVRLISYVENLHESYSMLFPWINVNGQPVVKERQRGLSFLRRSLEYQLFFYNFFLSLLSIFYYPILYAWFIPRALTATHSKPLYFIWYRSVVVRQLTFCLNATLSSDIASLEQLFPAKSYNVIIKLQHYPLTRYPNNPFVKDVFGIFFPSLFSVWFSRSFWKHSSFSYCGLFTQINK